MSNPPSYAAAVDSELQDITPTEKANAQAKIAAILAAPETRAAAIQEVDTLTTHAIKTDQAFEDIRVKLVNMEAVAVRDQWVGFVPLVGGWIQLQTVRSMYYECCLCSPKLFLIRTAIQRTLAKVQEVCHIFSQFRRQFDSFSPP